MKRFIPGFLALVFSLLLAVAANAATDSPVPIDESVPNIVGLGVGMVPDYQGSSHYEVAPSPYFRFSLGGQRYVQLLGTELNVNISNNPVLRFGPSINYRFGRSSSVKDDVVGRMEKISDTVEAGAFIGIVLVADTNPRQRFTATLDELHDAGNVSNGNYLTLSARYWYPISRPIDLTLGASGTYANTQYMTTYFGVNKNNVGSSGLPFFAPVGCAENWSVSPAMVFHLSEDWHVGAGVLYRRLVGEAAESPVVSLRGSRNQWVGGAAVAYSFKGF